LEVRLYLHIKKHHGKRGFAPAAYGKNSKILPQRALVDGQIELHPEGKYHLRYTRAASRSSSLSVPTQYSRCKGPALEFRPIVNCMATNGGEKERSKFI
jgi:hypothetical protein